MPPAMRWKMTVLQEYRRVVKFPMAGQFASAYAATQNARAATVVETIASR